MREKFSEWIIKDKEQRFTFFSLRNIIFIGKLYLNTALA